MRQNSSLAPRFRHAGVAAIVLLLAITSLAVPARVRETKETFAGISVKNFGKINDNYYRGAQPLNQEEFAQLKKFGIKTVIDLRKDSLRQAPDWARNSGLQYFNIPLLASTPATEDQTSYFLSLVNDPANWPVYVHCKSGKHRTGGMTALYRIAHDGWTVEQAYKEMEEYDFNGGIFGGPGAQKKFLYDYFDRHGAGSAQKSNQ